MRNQTVQRQGSSGATGVLDMSAAVLSTTAAAWDAAGALADVPSWWPGPGYLGIGAGIALGCVAVAAHVLTARHGARARRASALRLIALGVLLGAWLLRGHHEIPADPPIIVAQLAAATVLLITALVRIPPRA